MSSNKSTLHMLAEHLATALQPLSNSVSDLKSFKEFMFRLGWNVESLPPPFKSLADSIKQAQLALDSLPEDPTIDEISNLLLKVKEVYSALQSITEVPLGVDENVFRSEIAERIFEILLTDYLRSEFPAIHNALKMLSVIELQYFEVTDFRPSYFRTRFRFDQIEKIFSDPLSIPQIVYGWGTKDLNFSLVIDHLHELLQSLNFPTSVQRVSSKLGIGYLGAPEKASRPIGRMVKIPIFSITVGERPVEASLSVLDLPAEGDKLPGLIIQPDIPREIGQEIKVDDNLTIKVRAGTDLSSLFGFLLRPGELSIRYPFQPDSTLPDAGFGITLEYLSETATVLFGSREGNRLEMNGMAISLNANYNQDKSELTFVIEAALRELALVISAKEQDAFLTSLLGGSESKIPIPLIVGWSSKRGVYFAGSSGFGLTISPHLSIGRVRIDKLTLELLSGDRVDPSPNFATEILVGISGSIGPVAFSIDGIGLQLKAVFKDGNAGPLDIGVDVVLPKAIGLAINANGVKGGGFISRIESQYAGVIDLDLYGYSVQALAILRTDPFTSFLFAIFAKFKTAIQLGAGWKITKIGGMMGVNHTVSHNSVATGIKSGILDKILFPEDVIRDAPTVIANFETVFPVLNGQNIFGPAIQIAYGTPTLITADVAVILEFPNPFLLTILGKVTAKLPHKDNPIIQINIGVVGALDIVNGKAAVYGSLYDSKILDFALSGDMAMAASWGSEKNFIFSIGGFHPGFNPPSNFPPFNAPPLKRLNLAFSSHVNFQCYLALTSNTLQIGARVDAIFETGGVTISGFVGFDALVQFNPLYYVIDVAAGFSVKFHGRSLASIAFLGFIEGPNPHRIKGALTFSILWWDISVDVDRTFGEQRPEIIAYVDPLPILQDALKQNDSWTAELPSWESIGVVTKETSAVAVETGEQLIHPLGKFKVTQKVVPLNYTLTKFGSADPLTNFRFEITSISLNGTNVSGLTLTQDYFAPGQFTEFPESVKLNLKSYEPMDSGVYYTPHAREEVDFNLGSASSKNIEYETISIVNMEDKEVTSTTDKHLFALNTTLLQTLILSGILYHTTVSNSNKLKYQLKHRVRDSTLDDEKFVILDEDENTIEKFITISGGESSRSVALNKLADYRKANPHDKRNLIVISAFESPAEVPVLP